MKSRDGMQTDLLRTDLQWNDLQQNDLLRSDLQRNDLQRSDLLQIDLHVHSTRSDGTCSPAELVDYAMKKGLSAFAITDHDTVDGLAEAMEYAERLEHAQTPDAGAGVPKPDGASRMVPEVIPGIELSTEYTAPDQTGSQENTERNGGREPHGQDVHIVGIDIDYQNPVFRARLQEFVDSRTNRNRKMCGLLQDAGIQITYEALLEEFPDSVITRAHYAKYMLKHGYIKSLAEAFERYIGDRCPCFVPREKVTPKQAVELILGAGGIPILAHPILYHMSDARLEALTAELKEVGLIGIEALYSTYKPYEERKIRALAAKYDLCISGGSDFHGANKPGLDLGTGYGNLFVPYEVLCDLRKR